MTNEIEPTAESTPLNDEHQAMMVLLQTHLNQELDAQMADIRHTLNVALDTLEDKLIQVILPLLNERLELQLDKISAYFELKLDERLSNGILDLHKLDKLHSEVVTQSAYFSNVFNQLHTITQVTDAILKSTRQHLDVSRRIQEELDVLKNEVERLKKTSSNATIQDRLHSIEERLEQVEHDVQRNVRSSYGDALV
ncbi:MAG: hypothetical protein D6675_11470 [Gemmatimonadetes bacterium]|nr:MAG: hypothetical protein D6675_11470 [Gemmatimonadota bacterium]